METIRKSVGKLGNKPTPARHRNALVIHDNIMIHKRESQLSSIVGLKGDSAQWLRYTWWDMVHLRHKQIATLATQVSEQADFIIFAIHATEHFPDYVGAWLKTTLSNSGMAKPTMLLIIPASLNPADDVSEFAQNLDEIATSFEIPLHVMPMWEQLSGRENMAEDVHHRACAISPVLNEVLLSPIPKSREWGLND